MRFSSSTPGMLMKAGGLVVMTPWLLAASVAIASPAPAPAAAERACSTTARASIGHAAMVLPFDALWTEQVDVVLVRGDADSDADDGPPIQDDAPAARLDIGAPAPPLEPVGTLASPRDSLSSHRLLPRRSPRGPPVFR